MYKNSKKPTNRNTRKQTIKRMVKHFGLEDEKIYIEIKHILVTLENDQPTNERTNKGKQRKHQCFNFYLKLIFV